MHYSKATVVPALLFGLGLASCTGSVAGGSKRPSDGQNNEGGESNRGGADNVEGPGWGGEAGEPGKQVAVDFCVDHTVKLATPHLTRLTNTQYLNTIRDLFPGVTMTDLDLPGETRRREAFINQGEAQNPSNSFVRSWATNAERVGSVAAEKMSSWLSCSTDTDEAGCAVKLIDTLGKQAFRRPLTTVENQRYRGLVNAARAAYGFKEAVAMAVSALLQDPNFLYLIEKLPTGTNATDLSSYELASRLSYFLTDTMPDTELLAVAESGALLQTTRLQSEAQRLMTKPSARATVDSFHQQWLHLDKLAGINKRNAEFYPNFNAALAASLKESTAKFVGKVFWDEGGTFQQLLTSDHAFVDRALAPLYGVSAPSTGMEWTQVNSGQRAGLLTQPGLMAGLSNENANSPTNRGVLVLEAFLCTAIPSPPANADTTPVPPESGKPTTTRARMENVHLSKADCKGCHELIDGTGFAFENYDAIGAWRTEEMGMPINSKANISAGVDIDGDYDGAVDFVKALASSADSQRCFATHWLAYARGIATTDVDACAAQRVVRKQARGSLAMREMLVDIVLSDEFRKRAPSAI